MPTNKDDISLLRQSIDDGEFVAPDSDRNSWPRYLQIQHLYKGTNSSLSIYMKPLRIALSCWNRVVSGIAQDLGITINELYIRIITEGIYSYALNSTNPKLEDIKEDLRLQLKMASHESVEKQSRLAKAALTNDEYIYWCSRNGWDPDRTNITKQKSNQRTEIMDWAYQHYLEKSKFKTRYAIEDAIKMAVIEDSQVGTLKKLMSEWGVSGGERGVWDFTLLNGEIIDTASLPDLE